MVNAPYRNPDKVFVEVEKCKKCTRVKTERQNRILHFRENQLIRPDEVADFFGASSFLRH